MAMEVPSESTSYLFTPIHLGNPAGCHILNRFRLQGLEDSTYAFHAPYPA